MRLIIIQDLKDFTMSRFISRSPWRKFLSQMNLGCMTLICIEWAPFDNHFKQVQFAWTIFLNARQISYRISLKVQKRIFNDFFFFWNVKYYHGCKCQSVYFQSYGKNKIFDFFSHSFLIITAISTKNMFDCRSCIQLIFSYRFTYWPERTPLLTSISMRTPKTNQNKESHNELSSCIKVADAQFILIKFNAIFNPIDRFDKKFSFSDLCEIKRSKHWPNNGHIDDQRKYIIIFFISFYFLNINAWIMFMNYCTKQMKRFACFR